MEVKLVNLEFHVMNKAAKIGEQFDQQVAQFKAFNRAAVGKRAASELRNVPIPAALWNPHDFAERERPGGIVMGGLKVPTASRVWAGNGSGFGFGFSHQRRTSAGPTLTAADEIEKQPTTARQGRTNKRASAAGWRRNSVGAAGEFVRPTAGDEFRQNLTKNGGLFNRMRQRDREVFE